MTFPLVTNLQTRKKRVFYVDASGGSDSDNGRSPSSAWQTIAKVNGESFLPGDVILFKRGETWTGTQLVISDSGKKNAPIMIGAYGEGALPKIDGNDTVNCFTINNQDHIWIENLDLAQALDFGLTLVTCSYVHIENLLIHDFGNDGLIIADGSHHIDVYGGEYYDGYLRTGTPQVSGIEVSDGSYDVLLVGVQCYGQLNNGNGITIISHTGERLPWNIEIRDSICRNNNQHGIGVHKQDSAAEGDIGDYAIKIINCSIRLNNSRGISTTTTTAQRTRAVLISRCSFFKNVNQSIWLEGYGNRIDRIIHNGGRGMRLSNCKNTVFYKSTLYVKDWPGGAGQPLNIYGNETDGITIRDLIIVSAHASIELIYVAAGAQTNLDIDYVLYDPPDGVGGNYWGWTGTFSTYANWQAAGMDANSPTPADPLFVDPDNEDFTLVTGSTALNAGIDVGLPFVPPNPDLGRWEKGLDY